MNQNTSVDSDLQKAIDDITKSTNGDPLFADPVAAPVMPPAPNGVGPFPVTAPAPMPTPQIPSPNLTPEPVQVPNPATMNTPIPEMFAPEPVNPEPVAPAPVNPISINPEPINPEPIAKNPISNVPIPAEPVSSPMTDTVAPVVAEDSSTEPTTEPFERTGNLDIKDIKEAALRDLAPLLSKLDVPAERKFDIYKNVIDNYHDSSVIASAYRAASDIKDEHDRGEALLYIINSIDNM